MQFTKPIPFDEAVDKLGERSVIGATLKSSEWAEVPVAMRERAFFSSTVESTRFLQRARDSINDFLNSAREDVVGPDGVTRSALKTGGRQQFVKQMQAFALAEGMGPLDPKHKGTIRDITSQKRLELIFDTQVRQANDYGAWKQGQDPDTLAEYPAQRFIRTRSVKEPRNNHTIHEDQVALKSDVGFWTAINRDFNVPWGPWGWGCGHDVEDVDRDEAEDLGLIAPGEIPTPAEVDLNKNLKASTRGLDPDLIDKLRREFGDAVEITGDEIRWRGGSGRPRFVAPIAPTPVPQSAPTPQPATPPATPQIPTPAPSPSLPPQPSVPGRPTAPQPAAPAPWVTPSVPGSIAPRHPTAPPTPTPGGSMPPGAAGILGAYERGEISKTTAEERLRTAGYSRLWLAVDAVLRAYRRGEIARDTALEQLKDVGLGHLEAEGLLNR